MRWGDLRDVRATLETAYEVRSWRPLWITIRGLTPAARRIIMTLDSAATRGLDPLDFDAPRLEAMSDSLAGMPAAAVARYDAMLSVAVCRYVTAVSRGRIDPRVLHADLALPRDSIDAAALLGRLAGAAFPDSVIGALEPRDAQYRILVAWLADYRRMESRAPAGIARDSVQRRIRQIELTLERRRWLPRRSEGRLIVVNVPAFRLYTLTTAPDANRELASMAVVVGRAAGHATPLLTTSVVALEFHPAWVVPAKIAVRELRRPALRDTTYLRRHHYELLRGGTVVPPTRENRLAIGRDVTVRQLAGPWNALGRVKFVTPNAAEIYLHDTPERGLFARERRDFSHGCIRVADAQKLATFVLGEESGWTTQRIASALSSDSTFMVPLAHRIPVAIGYQTLVPADSGKVVVFPDVYGEDRRLDVALRRGYPYPAPSPGR